jgi:glutamate carboxypeptidase
MNWTVASAGTVKNVIPAEARATADVRVLRVSDYDGIEKQVRERIRKQLIPDTKVDMVFERTRPPLEATAAARAVAAHAKRIYKEIGKDLDVQDKAPGGGTDAAFASLMSKAAVIEGFGVKSYGAHSNESEFIEISSIAPRLYLATRLIMDVAQGKAGHTTN